MQDVFTTHEIVLAQLKLPKQITAQIRKAYLATHYVGGTVNEIITWDDGTKKKIIRPTDGAADGSDDKSFYFPPNTAKFEAELDRAQSGGLKIKVWYTINNDGDRIITATSVDSKA
jgi:hypothetical protein